jgi:1,4-dihydroxy-2-naphthoate octaprenyltransferase
MSVLFGTVAAVAVGGADFKPVLFVLALVGMAILHCGSNLLNDAFDYKKGLDTRVHPVSGAVVRGWITPRRAISAGIACFVAGAIIGVYIAYRVGWPVLLIGVLGLCIGLFYTWGPYPLKFNALGDLAVFLNFGILGSLGAWTVQTGRLSLTPVIWAIPLSLLVVAILHANNWRDISTDAAGGVRTMAGLFGQRRSLTYYKFLLFAPFALILLLMAIPRQAGISPPMPPPFLMVFFALPAAITLLQKARNRNQPGRENDFIALDGETARLNLMFGILCTAAAGLSPIFH